MTQAIIYPAPFAVTAPGQPVQPVAIGKPQRSAATAMRASHRWGVVLAGGDGIRLRQLTGRVWGSRPKQFCPILSDCTLLEETRHRAERSIPAEQILYSVMHAHEPHYLCSLRDRTSQTIVQPFSRGTAPAILYALLRIAQEDGDAIVSVFPCDHYYSSETAFTANLGSALRIAEQRNDSIVLLGAQPNAAEIEYGWIETGSTVGGRRDLFRVEGFQEKPPLSTAQELLEKGSLWNTFVIVGHVRAFLEMAWATVPSLVPALEAAAATSPSRAGMRIAESTYARIASGDFSRQILARATRHLLALRLKNLEWNDLGDPSRVLSTLVERDGDLPPWARLWFSSAAGVRSAAAVA
jgi:mannose-1-phosphate guanylyltransferase